MTLMEPRTFQINFEGGIRFSGSRSIKVAYSHLSDINFFCAIVIYYNLAQSMRSLCYKLTKLVDLGSISAVFYFLFSLRSYDFLNCVYFRSNKKLEKNVIH